VVILFFGDVAVPVSQLVAEFEAQGFVGARIAHQWSVTDNEKMVRQNRHLELNGPSGLVDWDELSALVGPARQGITGIVTQFFPVSRELIAELPSLSFVATVRSGTQNLDSAAAAERGIKIYNNPGRNAPIVADFTVALMLAACRGLALANRALSNGVWLPRSARRVFRTLASTRVGLVGFGQVGYHVARLLRGFEAPMRVYDPYLRTETLKGLDLMVAGSLQELIEESEVVSLHARVTPETVSFIGARELAWLGPDGILVNTARAELIDEPALLAALREGSICGAALDVFSEEPLPLDHELRRHDAVLLTPHLAGGSRDAPVTAVRLLATRLRAVTPPALWADNAASPRETPTTSGRRK
jgi:D-3-phosphoglycerate dehydrogenase